MVNQQRKVIDLIQTVAKALADLTELGNTGAMKSPLAHTVKKEWLVSTIDPCNVVSRKP